MRSGVDESEDRSGNFSVFSNIVDDRCLLFIALGGVCVLVTSRGNFVVAAEFLGYMGVEGTLARSPPPVNPFVGSREPLGIRVDARFRWADVEIGELFAELDDTIEGAPAGIRILVD